MAFSINLNNSILASISTVHNGKGNKMFRSAFHCSFSSPCYIIYSLKAVDRYIIMPNIFWKSRRFFIIIAAIQVAVLVLLGLHALNLTVPFVTQLVGFIYLTFIPGVIILRLFRLRKMGLLKTLLFSSALSVVFLMIMGLITNEAYPLFGISAPLSLASLLVTVSLLMIVLGFIAYVRDRKIPSQEIDKQSKTSISFIPLLFLILLPLLSILGTQIVNKYDNNIVLILMLCLVGTVPVLVIFTKLIPEKYHSLAVASVALCLVYHISLISNYLIGWDLNTEYQLANQVLLNSRWNPSIAVNYNLC